MRQRGKVKITDQSDSLLKQKLWFNTKKRKRTTALHQGWKWAFKISLRHSSFTSFSNGVPTPKKILDPNPWKVFGNYPLHCGGVYLLLGSYTNTIGLRLIREDVAKYISRRDGYPADVDDVILTNGGATGIQVRD